jgi:hypothetical protein
MYVMYTPSLVRRSTHQKPNTRYFLLVDSNSLQLEITRPPFGLLSKVRCNLPVAVVCMTSTNHKSDRVSSFELSLFSFVYFYQLSILLKNIRLTFARAHDQGLKKP